MNRSRYKIPSIILACLLVLNFSAGPAVADKSCLPPMCRSGLMDMDHCSGLFNFAPPSQGCCGNCNDIFCDLLNDPLKDANAAISSPFQRPHYTILVGHAASIGESGIGIYVSDPGHLLAASLPSSQIPLYLEHLSLII